MTKPVIMVDPSKVKAQLGTGLRDIALIVATASAVFGLVAAGNLKGALEYVQRPDALTALATVVVAAVTGYRQWQARRTKAREVALANAAPDSKARLTTDER